MMFARSILRIVQKIVHRMMQWPSKIVHQIYLLNVIRKRKEASRIKNIQDHSYKLTELYNKDLLIAKDLIEQGFSVTNAELFDYFGSNDFMAAADEVYAAMEEYYVENGKTINIIGLMNSRPDLLGQFKRIFRAGLDNKLLSIVENYLRLPVAYGGVDIFFTVADGLERGARTWHRDSEDNPMVKVAVYLNDVGDDDGPLEILHLQHLSPGTEKIRGFRQQTLIELQDKGKISFEISSFTGPRGTVVLSDTFKYFHRGKPITGKHRRALFYNYYTQKPLTPYFCPNPPFDTDGMQSLVSDLSTTQKRAALWREELKGVDKLVTKRRPYLRA